MNGWIRQFHRWVSAIFTVIVLALFAVQAFATPAEWVFYLPILPLLLLMASGIYLFLRPYLRKGRA